MTVVQSVTCDIDGDGNLETVQGMSDSTTVVLRGNQVLWRGTQWIDGWSRRPWDILLGVDLLDGAAHKVFIANNRDGWTGVLAWQGGALRLLWGAPSPLRGPAGSWNRRASDMFHPVGLPGTGREGVAISHPAPDEWHGILAWSGSSIGPITLSRSTTGACPITLLPDRAGIFSCSGNISDGLLNPPGALIRSVANTTLSFPSSYPSPVTVSVDHLGIIGVQLQGQGTPGDITYSFSGIPVDGAWHAQLGGTNIPDDLHGRQASLQVQWYMP